MGKVERRRTKMRIQMLQRQKKHTVGTENKRLGRWKLAKQKREQRVTKNTKRKG